MKKVCGNNVEADFHEGVYTYPIVSSPEDLKAIKDSLKISSHRWIFRGQSSFCSPLRNTFERKAMKGKTKDLWRTEAIILREFKRRAHHYIANESIPTNTLEWFSLMRHFGAPSRLLDCTYSFYVAEFFALRYLSESNCAAAIWAINKDWLKKCRIKILGRDVRFKNSKEFYGYFLSKNPKTFVSEVNPLRINQRLTAQQGVFLCPGNIGKPFMKNLLSMRTFVNPSSKKYGKGIIQIPIAYSMKTYLIKELRQMNISAATLFPDLIGFCESLGDWFHLADVIPHNDDELIATLRDKDEV